MVNEDKYLADLVDSAAHGDTEKTIELISCLYPIVSRYVSGILAASGNAYVDDVTQDTILKAVKTIQKGTDIDCLIPWVKRIARNTALDFLKSASVQRSVAFSDLGDENNNLTYDPSDERISSRPDLALDEKTRQQIVMEVLDTLPEDQRTVIMLKFYDNLTISEIAAELDIPQSTVIGRLQKGKTKIKRSITEIQDRDGIKLYGLAPFPFFLYLFKDWQTANLAPAAGAAGVSAAISTDMAVRETRISSDLAADNAVKTSSSTSVPSTNGISSGVRSSITSAKNTGLLSGITGSSLAFKAGIAAIVTVSIAGGASAAYFIDNSTAPSSLHTSEAVQNISSDDSTVLSLEETAPSNGSDKDPSEAETESVSNEPEKIPEMIVYKMTDAVGVQELFSDTPQETFILFQEYIDHNLTGYPVSFPSQRFTDEEEESLKNQTDFAIRNTSSVVQYPLETGNHEYTPDAIALLTDNGFTLFDYEGNKLINETFTNRLMFNWCDNSIYLWSDEYSNYLNIVNVFNDSFTGYEKKSLVIKQAGADGPHVYEKDGIIYDWNNKVTNYSFPMYAVDMANGPSLSHSGATGTALMKNREIHEFPGVYLNHDMFSNLVNGMLKVKDNKTFENTDDHYAFINTETLEQVTEFKYDQAKFFTEGLCPVRKNGKWGYIDETGKEVTDFIYDYASSVYDGKAWVGFQGSCLLINLKEAAENDICNEDHLYHALKQYNLKNS